jgi:hypothetical protein
MNEAGSKLLLGSCVPEDGVGSVPTHEVAGYDKYLATIIGPLFVRAFALARKAYPRRRNSLTTAE